MPRVLQLLNSVPELVSGDMLVTIWVEDPAEYIHAVITSNLSKDIQDILALDWSSKHDCVCTHYSFSGSVVLISHRRQGFR